MSDKHDSVNECTQEISESLKLHILGFWQMPTKLIGQLNKESSDDDDDDGDADDDDDDV